MQTLISKTLSYATVALAGLLSRVAHAWDGDRQ